MPVLSSFSIFNLHIAKQPIIFYSILTLCLICSVIAGWYMSRQITGESKSKQKGLIISLSVLIAVALILAKGLTMTALKGYLLFLILFQASISDIKTREVNDSLSAMILITALIDIQPEALPPMIFALIITGLPQLIIAAKKPGSYGGADIKITASAAFLLGVWKGLFALIIGLITAIVVPTIVRKVKKQSINEGIPMVPYLSVGILLAFIL